MAAAWLRTVTVEDLDHDGLWRRRQVVEIFRRLRQTELQRRHAFRAARVFDL